MRTLVLCRARSWCSTRTFFANPETIMDSSAAFIEEEAPSGTWIHYQHGDALDHLRWTAKECHQFLEERPWDGVLKFYSLLAAGKVSLSDLHFPFQSKYAVSHSDQSPSLSQVPEYTQKELKGGKWDRKTYKIVLAYDGSAFTGWQRQPGLHTVQGLLEEALGQFTDGKRTTSMKSEGFSPEAAVSVAGRTDKGVHAAGQVCSFYTWQSDINREDITNVINKLQPGALRAVSVHEVSRTFHPNFSAQLRRYVYLLPLRDEEVHEGCTGQLHKDNEPREPSKPNSFSVTAVNDMLSKLEGRQLSYAVFARDTKAARSRGPATECVLCHARAAIAELPFHKGLNGWRNVLCVELVGDRFLRKMVRVLVATSIREAAAGAQPDCLLRLTDVSSRRATAPPAPPSGLCLTEVSYESFSKANLLIRKPA